MEHRKELQDYIDTIFSRDGSDIHLIVGSKPLFREKKELLPFIQKDVLTEDDLKAFTRLITQKEDQIKRLEEEKQVLFSFKTKTSQEQGINFRVNIYKEKGNTAIALRLIKEKIGTIEELNLPQNLKQVMESSNGLFLVVGPTGNGKSTALAAMIEHSNNVRRNHILTIEDPIEFIFKNKKAVITQREIPSDADSFRFALDNSLRADADVLMIGEMREFKTMQVAVTAAEVGHVVLSTLHSNSASGAISRIIDSFPGEQQQQIANQLSNSLLGICSIRLLHDKNGGLIPACEFLLNNTAISNIIREGRLEDIRTVLETGREKGMFSLDQSLAELVKADKIALETASMYATDKRALNKYF